MSAKNITRVSLEELQARKARGELPYDPNAPETETLDRAFWAEAQAQTPKTEVRSVHLKIDSDVFDFFKQAGRGHLTRMQEVLKAYARAHRPTERLK